MAVVKLSSKRQVTLPAGICRKLNLKEGDRLLLEIKDDRLILTRMPGSFSRYLSGSAGGIYGRTMEEIDRYVRKERDSWE
ncbi:MAG: AbrB/MazE/SpoVT family DNA-binding domain-containing protein [Thermoanaerobacteraceae bacterium]|nr:AbrB/MazE/SpoVT family DNA-binding domain-containing protein [Desulfofundulus thermobenzoicus]MBE3588153.1 AbrB/MazE/SpoVT family DNA-binding domain-containing protein [Thermoanaerobacteraceae bacterium]HHW44383.1 AbrB/MazE/SpoVT family DNA-binding domain-containing protein [Desulfotomaculum sp.]